jgi:branched-chain amino acid aminotransferase
MDIKITRTATPKIRPDESKLGFGKLFTDHMFIMDYTTEKGWHDARIVPYGPILMDPAAMVLHYAQETFEGLKAYRRADGKVQLFRPDANAARMERSNRRMAMPEIPAADFVQAVRALVEVDQDWVPNAKDTSLYIRPMCVATQPAVSVSVSSSYMFMVLLSPSGSYYPEGVNPVKIFVEDVYVRAVQGGTGEAKTGGNYAASLMGQVKAKKMGYSQVMWLDGVHRKFVEEIGTTNVIFKINGEIITPSLEGTILPGITRDSALKLMRHWGLKVTERKISIDEVVEAYDKGQLEEVFAVGTAAVVSPVGELCYKGKIMTINNFKNGEITQKVYDTLTDIQWGRIADDFGWIQTI